MTSPDTAAAPDPEPTSVTVLGTGAMGAGMARSLARSGFRVTVWNRTLERAEPLTRDGITVADDLAAAVAGAEVVLTMLYDLDATTAVLREVLPLLTADTVLIQAATLGAPGARQVAALADEHGIASLDAPVLGTKGPANDGLLTVLVSGPSEVVGRAGRVFAAVGAKTVLVGEEPGAASALKLACNSWVASVTAATAQALALARDGGVDPALFLEAIEGGAVDSPYAQVKGRAMIAADYTTSFRLDGVRKDLDLMVDQATTSDTRVLEALRATYAAASAAGHAEDDMAAVVEAFGGAR